MGGGGPAASDDSDLQMSSDGSVVVVTRKTARPEDDTTCTLLWCKSAVYVHPTSYQADNVRGFCAVVQRDGRPHFCWLPVSLLLEDEREQFMRVEIAQNGSLEALALSEEEAVQIRPPAREGPDHAFAAPIVSLYSLIVHPPTITSWYGSVTATANGVSFPTLYFHDDESPSTVFSRDRRANLAASGTEPAHLPSSWGGEALVRRLRKHADVVRSTLEPALFLVNPSRADLEAHSTPAFDDIEVLPPSMRAQREPRSRSVLHEALSPESRRSTSSSPGSSSPKMSDATFGILNSFSKITRNARTAAQAVAQPILSHRLARPILPHLPPPLANLAQAKPEWVQWEEAAGVEGFSTARIYLAKWARIVSEEGERARRAEVGASADGEEASALGAFEVLASTYSISRPRSTRAVGQPIVESEWTAWFSPEGQLMLSDVEARKRVFQRGLSPSARRLAWPFLLGVHPWTSTAAERKDLNRKLAHDYEALKAAWRDDAVVYESEKFIEENHRIEIDCRRTDRTHPLFAADDGPEQEEEISAGPSRVRNGGQAPSNPHVRQMQQILLTYNSYDTSATDGYVQGMSDLCSPLYICLDGDEPLVFWCFVRFMDRVKSNFARDQAGMKEQLSILQQLIALMDPGLYRHLERTDSLNLFCCFRWYLIVFKREFSLDQTCLIWDTLFTDYYGRHFHHFIALAILQAHRDIIIRYLLGFDEVLKYINELSGTIEAEPNLCQAEVAAITFREIVEIADRRRAEEASAPTAAASSKSQLRQRGAAANEPTGDEDTEAARPGPYEIDESLRVLLPNQV